MAYAHSDYALRENNTGPSNYGRQPPSASSYPPAPGLPLSSYLPPPGLPLPAYPQQTYYASIPAQQPYMATTLYPSAPGYPVSPAPPQPNFNYASKTAQQPVYFSHEHLLKLVKEFAPNITHSGVCNGVTTTWAQSSLTGNKQKQEFFDRFNFIKENYVRGNEIDSRALARDVKNALQRNASSKGTQPLTEHENKLLDVRAFCETVAIHQDPGSTNVFADSYTQHQRNEIFPLTASKQQEENLGKDKPIVANSIGTVALKQDAYANYLQELQGLVASEAANGNKAVILHALGNHVVGLSAEPGSNKWNYFDINGKPLEFGLDSKQVSSFLHRNYGADATGNYNMGEVSVVSTNGSPEFLEKFNNIKAKHFKMPEEPQAKTDLLVIASMNGEGKLVNQLLDATVDPNTKSSHRTALGMAVIHGQQETVKLLMERGADPNEPHLSEPPLIHAIKGKQNQVAVELLSSKKINPNMTDFSGNTSLHLATKSDNTELAKSILANNNTNPNLLNNEGNAALHIAVSNDNQALSAAILANRKTNPDILDSGGCAPLHLAAGAGNNSMVGQLLANKANPTIVAHDVDGTKYTPLSVAVATGKSDIVTTLLKVPKVQAELQSKEGQAIFNINPQENEKEIKMQLNIAAQPHKNTPSLDRDSRKERAMEYIAKLPEGQRTAELQKFEERNIQKTATADKQRGAPEEPSSNNEERSTHRFRR